jgi:hypothetical protein
MRQNSPFAGILPANERRAVLESFRVHWRNGTDCQLGRVIVLIHSHKP